MKDKLLISLVEGYPHIYNRSDVNYKNDHIKQNSWETISASLGVDVQFVKRRWDNLRDRFVRTHRQLTDEKDGISQDGSVKINFPYYNEMLFLVQHIRKRKMTPYTYLTGESADEQSRSAIAPKELGINLIPVQKQDPLSDSASSCEAYLSPNCVPQLEYYGEQTTPPRKKKCTDCYENSLTTIVKTFDKYMQNATVSANGDSSFMKSVVEDMQHLSKKGKIKFKYEVYKLLEKLLEDYSVDP